MGGELIWMALVHEGQIESNHIFLHLRCAMRVLENKDLAVARKVHLVLLVIAVSSCCCTARPQTTKCLIQSFYRAMRGSGKTGIGNLLLVHVQSHAPFAPTRLSFTGSCSDSTKYTEFRMRKKIVNGSLTVSFRWNHGIMRYGLAIRNRTLVIEHIRNLNHQDEFVLECAPSDPTTPPSRGVSCAFITLRKVLSSKYVSTDDTGKPLVGTSSTDVTTWFNMQCVDIQKHLTACQVPT